jgi:hypothetical protein
MLAEADGSEVASPLLLEQYLLAGARLFCIFHVKTLLVRKYCYA